MSADSSGSKVSELRYRAWGETRYIWGSGMATDRRYTGQRQEMSRDAWRDTQTA